MAAPQTALCLSGGGFRATLFHLGAVRRLNEFGVLSGLDTVTSVSGGSILNGVLATRWGQLRLGEKGVFTNFDAEVAKPVEKFCNTDLRTPLLFGVRLNPFNFGLLFRDLFSIRANFLADAYRKLLPQNLSSLPPPGPAPDGRTVPRFIFIATNVVTGVSWQFHCGPQARMGDFHAGYWPVGETGVADAVAASSAFPPGFSALRLKVPVPGHSRIDPWGEKREPDGERVNQRHLTRSGRVLLTDGGVYDNLGLQPVWDRGHWALVSDAQQLFQSDPDSSQWLVARLSRAVDITMGQVSALRKRWLVDRIKASGDRWSGVVWKLSSDPATFPKFEAGYGNGVRDRLVRVRTDLNQFTMEEMGCLQNVGYWVADAAVRSHWKGPMPNAAAPFVWPNREQAVDATALASLAQSHRRRLLRDLVAYVRGRFAKRKLVPGNAERDTLTEPIARV